MDRLERLGKGNALPQTKDNAPIVREQYNTLLDKVNEIVDDIAGAKQYVARITDNGDTTMSVTVFKNSLGTLTFTYDSVGTWFITSANLFTEDKTIPIKGVMTDENGNIFAMEWVDANTIELTSKDDTGTLTDSLITNIDIEILVYV